jgi:hypothetical protein
MFGPKREDVEVGENCIMRSFIICSIHQIIRVMKTRGL